MVIFVIWYVTGLRAYGFAGRIGIVENPDAAAGEWRITPAADSEVFVRWNAEIANDLIHWPTRCERTLIVRTDREGRYSFDGWWHAPAFPPPRMQSAEVQPMQPGLTPAWGEDIRATGYTSLLRKPPDDSAIALSFIAELDPVRRAERDRCPPPGAG